jgi:hypothetical protein
MEFRDTQGATGPTSNAARLDPKRSAAGYRHTRRLKTAAKPRREHHVWHRGRSKVRQCVPFGLRALVVQHAQVPSQPLADSVPLLFLPVPAPRLAQAHSGLATGHHPEDSPLSPTTTRAAPTERSPRRWTPFGPPNHRQSLRPSIHHCKPALNLLSLFTLQEICAACSTYKRESVFTKPRPGNSLISL